MEAVFDAPVVAITAEHLLSAHLRRWTRSNQVLDFGFFGGFAWDLNRASEPGGLFGEGETDAGGADLKSRQATFFGATAVDFRGLGARSFVLRGKKRATDSNRVVARSSRLQADCL